MLDSMGEIPFSITIDLHYTQLQCECVGAYELKDKLVRIMYQIVGGLYETAYFELANLEDDLMKTDIREGITPFQDAITTIEILVYG